jgi:membrane protease YdiL (CAAX protease family)
MSKELHRILKTFIYKLFIYFPVTIILAYAFYRDFGKDLGFAGASVGIGMILYYLFDWTWHHKETKRRSALIITIAWILLLIIGFTLTGIDSIKHSTKNNDHDHRDHHIQSK